jgi:methylglutaconyl-CoA hydratase
MTRVLVRSEGAVGRLTLARPDKKNALDRQTADELVDGLMRVAADPAVHVVVLDGQGADFCAGADLDALERLLDAGPEAHRDDAQALGTVFRALRDQPTPVVAVVRGRALAGGAGLANACDLVLAHENALFGYPEVRIGFVPAMVMTMLRRSVGEKHALDLLLTGRSISAHDAERIGLASRVIPDATFDADVAAIVQSLAASPLSALTLTKRLFHAQDGLSFDEGIDAGIRVNVEARGTDAFRLGVRHFLERRDRAR